MRPATSSSSASSSSSRPKKRTRLSREQLLHGLEILGQLAIPLPPDLPPSPPASRSASPAPSTGSKRKLDSPSAGADTVKRPRTSTASERAHPPHSPQRPHAHPLPPRPSSTRAEPTEDGELPDEPLATTSSATTAPSVPAPPTPAFVPIRRPRRGKPSSRDADGVYEKYHDQGRRLKYSGDARFWSTFPPSHKEYKPLAKPPAPHTPYHQHGGLIARLELVDALVCFTYSIWARDYVRKQCLRETWTTIESFLCWCKLKWKADNTVGERERAFLGLIWMIEAFIHGRKYHYLNKMHTVRDASRISDEVPPILAKLTAEAIAAVEKANGMPSAATLRSQPTPPMLPSPASIGATSSANSTPTGRGTGTPNGGSASSSAAPSSMAVPVRFPAGYAKTIPREMLALQGIQPPPATADRIRLSMTPQVAQNFRSQAEDVGAAGFCAASAQETLNLPVLARHFPATFARMIYTSLAAVEEHEPEFEDDEGELFWPGQLATGEGLGWVCLMGKAMIKEFGKEYGYLGLEGVVPKPKIEEQTGPATPAEVPRR